MLKVPPQERFGKEHPKLAICPNCHLTVDCSPTMVSYKFGSSLISKDGSRQSWEVVGGMKRRNKKCWVAVMEVRLVGIVDCI